jgi:hypothetical protein
MPSAAENLLNFALETIADVSRVSFVRDLGNNVFQFRDIETGRFTYAENVWQKFREDYVGGGQ